MCDNGLEGDKLRINICQDKKIRMKFLHFEHLKMDVESEQKVLVTVEMNSSDRKASLETVRDLVKQSLEKANGNNYTNHQQNNEIDENDW